MTQTSRGSLSRFVGLLAMTLCLPLSTSFATTFTLPPAGDTLLGDTQSFTTNYGDSTASIAQHFDVGVNAIVAANPGVSENMIFRSGTTLKIASQFLLPPLPYRGIIINLPEMRMYYFPEGTNTVMTFPIGIGRVGKTIPITNTAVTRKVVNPVWIPTPDIRKFNEDQGIKLPAVKPAGQDNPLGPYAIYMRIPTYLIHSTIFPESIGRRASFGCIRMNENDIQQFFPTVQPGTPVVIVDMPYKLGWEGQDLFLESHPPLEERNTAGINAVVEAIQSKLPTSGITMVDWQLVAYLTDQPDGVPHEIGVRLN